MTDNILHAVNDNWTPCACGSKLVFSGPFGWTCSVCAAPRPDVARPVSVRFEDAAAFLRPVKERRVKTCGAVSAGTLTAMVLLSGCQSAPRPNVPSPMVRYHPPPAPPPSQDRTPSRPPIQSSQGTVEEGGGSLGGDLVADPAGIAVAAATTGGTYLLLKGRSAQAAAGMTPPPPPPPPAPNLGGGPRTGALTGEAEAGAAGGEGATVGESVALGVARRFIGPLLLGGVLAYELIKPKEP